MHKHNYPVKVNIATIISRSCQGS